MSIQSLLNQQITHYPEQSFDRYGKEIDSSIGTDYDARVQQVTKTKFLGNGQVVNIDLTVMLDGDPPVNRGDQIKYLGQRYRVYGKKQAIVGSGDVHHVTLDLQQWSK